MKERSSFSSQLGFVLASAGSAVGLGNIWRFPYLAAKDGGGLFLVIYLILLVTFGFALLTTEITIGRKTGQGPLTAYGSIRPKWGFIGFFACLVPIIILPYYCAIGGWVFKYLQVFITGKGLEAAKDGFFGGYITGGNEPIVWMLIFLGITAIIIYTGVEKGIERLSKIIMPLLFILIVGIGVFSLTTSYTDDTGVTRTGLQGLAVYVIPSFEGVTVQTFLYTIMDALGQLFFSISVAMGIMVAYGSYAKKEVDLGGAVNRIELMDTMAAFLAGLMIVPAVFTFMGREGMSAGPGLIFISLPKVFEAMGGIGIVIGIVFFITVSFAAVTSSISIMEAIVSSFMDKFKWSRVKSTTITLVYAVVMATIVCLGYTVFYFEKTLPNGSVAQILDIMDYISNNIFMPFVALTTCILIGWIVKPETIIEEVEQGGKFRFRRELLYRVMMRFIAPILLAFLLLQAFGIV